MISELMQDDLPAPVAPAIRMWGIVARFDQHGPAGDVAADRDLERVRGPAASARARMSPSATSWRLVLGTSTPMACRPGIGARMRTSGDAIA